MSSKRKVFFALLPNPKTLEAIVLLQRKFQIDSGRWIVAENIHLTLCFIGHVDELQLKCISGMADELIGEKIQLNLDVIGQFNKAKILWLGSRDKCNSLYDLHYELCKKLKLCQLELNSLKFRPHITLARNAHNNTLAPEFESIDWFSNVFYLMESVQVSQGVEYKVLKQYSLG